MEVVAMSRLVGEKAAAANKTPIKQNRDPTSGETGGRTSKETRQQRQTPITATTRGDKKERIKERGCTHIHDEVIRGFC